jgi:lipopolysaccharide transport system permease protein
MTPLPEIAYTSESELRAPREFLTRVWRDLRSSRELAWQLFASNLRAQYRQSLLGYVWALLPPLVTTLTWLLLNAAGILKTGNTSIPYPLYVLLGTVLWQFFVEALNVPLNSLSQNRSLLTKLNFPREALVLAGLGETLFNFCIRLVPVFAVMVWLHVLPTWTLALAPLGIFALLLLGLGIGLYLVPFGLLYQDVARGLGIVTTLWFFVTPIVYTPPNSSLLRTLVEWNPVTPLVRVTRDWMTTGGAESLGAFFLVMGSSCVLCASAWVFVRLALPHLTARMSGR